MKITTEVLGVLENSFLTDLQDALEVETDADLLEAIKEEIARRIDKK
jgi:hypothetical protein